mmetsp:Transcript_46280/g.110289  ORF Transcript_46280/g.110289 Transcript_46280/m.110289 type:complete len:195 (+) Transcript_46280:329-913(+)
MGRRESLGGGAPSSAAWGRRVGHGRDRKDAAEFLCTCRERGGGAAAPSTRGGRVGHDKPGLDGAPLGRNHWAANTWHRHGEVAKVLLQHRADVSATTNWGATALLIAALRGNDELVRVLIEHRANVLAETNLGWTAVFIAAVHSHLEVVAMLKAEAVSRAKCVAFAMGHHQRLGAGSRVEWLEPGVLRMVLEQV